MSTAAKPKLAIIDGRPMTTSIAIAEHFGKEHRNVLRAIDVVLSDLPALLSAGREANMARISTAYWKA
jgi:phage regulator Rha-like protein